MTPARLSTLASLLRWGTALAVLAFGAITFDRESSLWAAFSLVLFAVPLIAQATPWVVMRSHALWLGVLLVAQSLVGPLVRSDYVTLPPNLRSSVDVRTPEVPGVPPGLRRVTTDAQGYRATPAIDYSRKARTRIVAIGGSTTEDIMLDDRSTWTHLLQEGLKSRGHDVEVINTGVSGLRARHHVATLGAVMRHEPDLVLVMAGANDWNRHIREHFEPDLEAYTLPTFRESPLGRMLGRFIVTPVRMRLPGAQVTDRQLVVSSPEEFVGERSLQSLERPVIHSFRPADVAAGYRDDMAALSAACREHAVPCLFLTQPHAYSENPSPQLRRFYWMTPPFADYTVDLDSMLHITSMYNAWLLRMAGREGHPSCDVARGMEASEQWFFDDMHYTDEGARLVAALVQPCVEALLAKG